MAMGGIGDAMEGVVQPEESERDERSLELTEMTKTETSDDMPSSADIEGRIPEGAEEEKLLFKPREEREKR